MIHTLPQTLIEAARKILESQELKWAVGDDKDKAQMAHHQKGQKILLVDANEVINNTHPDERVSPYSDENHIGNRMQRAMTHFKSGQFMDPPEIHHANGQYPITVGNGRHRMAASILLGKPIIPVVVHPDDESKIRNTLTVHGEIPND